MRKHKIRDLVTGKVIVREGFTAEELLKQKEPVRDDDGNIISRHGGERRYVKLGSEPAGWQVPKGAPQTEADADEILSRDPEDLKNPGDPVIEDDETEFAAGETEEEIENETQEEGFQEPRRKGRTRSRAKAQGRQA